MNRSRYGDGSVACRAKDDCTPRAFGEVPPARIAGTAREGERLSVTGEPDTYTLGGLHIAAIRLNCAPCLSTPSLADSVPRKKNVSPFNEHFWSAMIVSFQIWGEKKYRCS